MTSMATQLETVFAHMVTHMTAFMAQIAHMAYMRTHVAEIVQMKAHFAYLETNGAN